MWGEKEARDRAAQRLFFGIGTVALVVVGVATIVSGYLLYGLLVLASAGVGALLLGQARRDQAAADAARDPDHD